MALNELESFFERADSIQSKYDEMLKNHKLVIRTLEASCRRSEEGHVWLMITRPPIRYLGPPTYLQICQCCGFYCQASGARDKELIRKALSTEVKLSPVKEDIRGKALEEYGEKQDELDSLNDQLTTIKKDVREIIDKCQIFLGEKQVPVKQGDDGDCYWD